MVETHPVNKSSQPICLAKIIPYLGFEGSESGPLAGEVCEEIGESGQCGAIPSSECGGKTVEVEIGIAAY